MVYILDNLAIGDFGEAQEPPEEIDTLLCVAEERDLPHVRCLYCKVPLPDMTPIQPALLKEAVTFIHNTIAHHKIMIYCNAGIGRSPSTVIAYLCCFHGYGFGDAVEFVATKKPYISTLPNLILSIKEVKQLLKEENTFYKRP